MTTSDPRSVLNHAANQHRLLDHPYYQAWQAGELTNLDLAQYAAQYRYVEQALPAALEQTAAQLPTGAARRWVEDNLADEMSHPRPHLELFDGFAKAVGADLEAPVSPRTAQLVATYRDAAAAGPVAALAVIGAYEVQAAEVAATKGSSLRQHYGLDAAATEFWDVHARLEATHADWTARAIEELSDADEDFGQYADQSATAWWAFLDERHAARV